MAGLMRSPLVRRVLPLVAGAAIVAATVLAVGTGPFVRGLQAITPAGALAAVALGVIATLAAAARWTIVARRLGIPLDLRTAVASSYRAQFLNAVLPGGVLGDAHRAWAHGRDAGVRTVRTARAVVVERALGQAVQLAVAAVVLGLAAGSSAAGLGFVAVVSGAVVLVAAGIVLAVPRVRRLLGRELRLVRLVVASPGAALGITLTSLAAVGCYTATFVVAGLAVGAPATPALPVGALVALSAAAVPVNLGGWGPREAAAAAAFATIGLGAATGLATATAFGVLTMIAVAPGAVVVLAGRWGLRRRLDRRIA
jgi:glycosyltransferase 2 family protein